MWFGPSNGVLQLLSKSSLTRNMGLELCHLRCTGLTRMSRIKGGRLDDTSILNDKSRWYMRSYIV